ncbi:MAG: pyridoxal phosphate-dependent aminotransferase [Cryomorphaceae bacterium]|jgi:aspartate aminotransferase|nr:pyridoxal phosphate-dependent aminotransferase [Cryomorphaceae bacterium]MBT7659742.1 pyridoxal phosphate-dependent aminotransferase [Bacteroidota bacterium]MCH1405697.1 pyridoxal phosphate-dependent aminotransferase [Schleiferiaceae bacterium]MCO4791233.1 pyridoxal phosphate-dependent aminotransferase [Flavobacteriales bacterium]MBL6681785.1 pyridoxal phosphate-dependent aminotransferase [Cryomorphaceae bacterium]
MPTVSRKGEAMPSSPIRKLVPFAENAERAGKKVFYLNIGQPDIHTPEVAQRAIKEADVPVLAYSHSAGFASLRAGLSEYYHSKNLRVTSEEIIVTTGGSEALLFTFGSAMDEGDEVIIPEPFYANYNGFATASGVKVIPVESNIENGFALPPVSAFEAAITPKTKGIMICNPGNPTGYLYSKEELNQLKAIVLKHDLFLIADEVYREFTYDGAEHYSILGIEGLEEHAIVVDSFSKRYSMCGARIGCLVSKNRHFMATAMKFAQARLSPPTYAQIASEAALKTPQSYFDTVNTEYVERRNVLVDGLNSIDGVFCPKPKGAFYAVAAFPVESAEHFAEWLLSEFDHNGKTLMMAPAAGFYAKPELGRQQARLAYVLNVEDLKECIEIVRHALQVYPGTIK